MTVIALVAAEASGDQLGAALMRAIHTIDPDIRFAGIGGPKMQAAGLDTWWDSADVSVMGLTEVVTHLPRLLYLRRALLRRLLALQADVFVGIDAPDFNLAIERKLKNNSIPVVHYVSPAIWAWRPGRVKTIARATDHVLCLFPFEPACYQLHDVRSDYTGHPLADQIPLYTDAGEARTALKINDSAPCIALLPGSRDREVEMLAPAMLSAAVALAVRYPGCSFVLAAATERIHDLLSQHLLKHPALNARILSNCSTSAIAAADVVICASGTATLETMLINRPMVVCYRVSFLTSLLMKGLRLLKSRFIALPNILAAEALVPELLQQDVSGTRIAEEVSHWLDEPSLRQALVQKFERLHRRLQKGAAEVAAKIVLQHIPIPS